MPVYVPCVGTDQFARILPMYYYPPCAYTLPKVSIGNLKIAKMLDIRFFWVAEPLQREILSIFGGNSVVNGHDLPLEA